MGAVALQHQQPHLPFARRRAAPFYLEDHGVEPFDQKEADKKQSHTAAAQETCADAKGRVDDQAEAEIQRRGIQARHGSRNPETDLHALRRFHGVVGVEHSGLLYATPDKPGRLEGALPAESCWERRHPGGPVG